MLDDVVRVDHEGRAQGHAFVLIEHPERTGELAARIGELPHLQAVQVRMLAPPAELGVLVVDRAAHDDRVAVLELPVEPGESGDLGRADEGEVLGIEEDHLPLPREALRVDGLEGADALLFVVVETGLHARDLEVRQLFANTQHHCTPLKKQNDFERPLVGRNDDASGLPNRPAGASKNKSIVF